MNTRIVNPKGKCVLPLGAICYVCFYYCNFSTELFGNDL